MTGIDLDPTLVRLLADRPRGVLTTIKRDGRPQLSVVAHHYDEPSRTLHVSVTADRQEPARFDALLLFSRPSLTALV